MVEVNNNDEIMKKEMVEIKKRLLESLENYRVSMSYLCGDAPMGVLCLPKTIETVLANQGFFRVYDLFNRDLTEIKGLGVARISHLTASLDKFVSMS